MLRRTPLRASAFARPGATVGSFVCTRRDDALSDLADPHGTPMTGSLWEHAASGTRVLFFSAKAAASDSEKKPGEKALALGFCTPAENDAGATHILEHTVLCGSEKYPTVRDPFFKMLRRSLSTFMNAMTGPDFTVYPFSTMNEQDFFNILDVYLDCTLHPLIRPLDFAQEAHRLKVLETPPSPKSDDAAAEAEAEAAAAAAAAAASDDVDAGKGSAVQLQRTGVVLNEMKGALSDATTFFLTEFSKHAHAHTPYAHCFGGNPPAIPELSHADLVSYYGRHYQRPVIALFDSTVASEREIEAFLDKTLGKILTEVTKPRKVLESCSAVAAQSEKYSALEALTKLRVQQHNGDFKKSIAAASSFSFSFGPADPIPPAADGSTTARIGVYAALPSIIRSFVESVDSSQASRADHKALFEMQLLFHILMRPPSGPLYRAILHNAANTAALTTASDVAAVQKRTAELVTAKDDGAAATNENGDAAAADDDDGSSSTLDLIPGSGLDLSTQVASFFLGIQNVPAPSASLADSEKNATLLGAKCELVRVIVAKCLSEISATGLARDLVESSMHEFELSLRARNDPQHAVNAAIGSVSAVMRGLDPFHSHNATDLDTEVAAAITKTFESGSDSSAPCKFFSEMITTHLLPQLTTDGAVVTKAVAGSEEFVAQQEAEMQTTLAELSKTVDEKQVAEINALDAQLLAAQKTVDDGASLPTLDVADIARAPVNYTEPSNGSDFAATQSFVTNTAGLVYCRLLLPIPASLLSSEDDADGAALLPLFSYLYDKLGLLDCSVAEQDVRVRKVCSGFGTDASAITVPPSAADLAAGVQPASRVLEVGFHCLPKNLEASIELLTKCFDANCGGLWSALLKDDAARRGRLLQLVTMLATDLENQIVMSGTRFATAEAVLHAVNSVENAKTAATSDNIYGMFARNNGLTLARSLSARKTLYGDCAAAANGDTAFVADDSVDGRLWTYFEKFARGVFQNNRGATAYVVAGPNDHEAARAMVDEKLLGAVRGRSKTFEDTAIIRQPSLFSQTSSSSSSSGDAASRVLRVPLPSCEGSAFVGAILPTPAQLGHELAPALALALSMCSQEFLHREVREIGGAYGAASRLGLSGLSSGGSGIVAFASYRDPTPDRTLDILKSGAMHKWFLGDSSNVGERMLREAKLSVFGGIDAPLTPSSVGSTHHHGRFSLARFAKYRQDLLDVDLASVNRAVDEFLHPDKMEKMMTACVLGGKQPQN